MMKTLFLTLSQGWLEIAVAVGLVLLLRLCLRPFPKYLTCLLWLGVLFRLLCPFSLPKAANPLPAIPAPEIPLSSALTASPQPAPAAGSFDWLGLLSLLWLIGLALFVSDDKRTHGFRCVGREKDYRPENPKDKGRGNAGGNIDVVT